MDEFTKAEIERINHLYGTDFKDITPDDAMLIGRVEAYKAMQEGEYKARIKAVEEEAELRLEQARENHAKAMENLETLAKAAKARLKAVEDEQQK